MAIVVACVCALPSSPLVPYADLGFKGVGGTRFIVGWWLLVVKFLVRCLLERILALMVYILVLLFVSFEIF